MGDEADRLIDRMQFPHYINHRRSSDNATVGSVVDDTSPMKPSVHFEGLGVYCCLAAEPVSVGQLVAMRSDGKVIGAPDGAVRSDGKVTRASAGVSIGQLHFNINTDIFYEGFDEADGNQHPSTLVKTNITCSYCQAKGLHWSGKKGVNLKLRDENGFVHDCGRSKVTISL
ncbi:hypothetical protein D3C81_365170 [compost metagenome]